MSASPAGPQLYIDRADDGISATVVGGAGAAVLLVSNHGIVGAAPVEGGDWSGAFPIPGDLRYVRAQLVGPSGDVLALTSPLWFD